MLNEEDLLHEKISSPADFCSLYSEENGLGRVKEFIESNSDLLSELDAIKEVDRKGYFEIVKTLTDMIAEGYFDPEDVSKLIRHFVYKKSSAKEDTERYGAGGVAGWRSFQVEIYEKLFQKDENGDFVFDIAHNVGHEMGHSLIESKSVKLPEELITKIEEIDTKFESKHIQRCVENKMDEQVLRKERLAEVFGVYLNCDMSLEEFLSKRYLAIPKQIRDSYVTTGEETDYSKIADIAETNEEIKTFIEQNIEIFTILSSCWPQIQESLKSAGDEYSDEEEDEYGDDGETANEEIITTGSQGGEEAPQSAIAQEFGQPSAEQPDKNTNKKGFSETTDLGRKENDNENVVSAVKNLMVSIASEVSP